MKTYFINAVANMVGLSQKRLRDYERLGFIKPQRQAKTNNRLYTDADIERIRHLQELIHKHGFTLKCLQYFIASAPCWTIFRCDQRGSCPAFGAATRACYELKAEGDAVLPTACANCPIHMNRHTKLPAVLKRY
jgi:hypothetical protein